MNIGRIAIACITTGACITIVTGLVSTAPVTAAAVTAPRHPVAAAAAPTSDQLSGVSCPSTSFCLAVGSAGSSPAAQVWNGSIWTELNVPVSGTLTGVSCVSTTGCMVVGSSPAGPDGEWWNGSTWRAVSPQPLPRASFSGVSCVSSSNCIAVGEAGGQAMSQAWNGTAWRVLNTPDPGGPNSGLAGVSCSSATSCMAVGWAWPDNDQEITLALQWNGSSWQMLSTPPDNFNISPVLNGVSCLSSTDCMAVGSGGGSDGSAPLAVQWNGSTWAELSTPGTGTWFGVSCVTGGNCFAVGGSTPASGSQPSLAAEWDGGTWQVLNTLAAGSASGLYGLSCENAANCMAVGSYEVPGGAWLDLDGAWNGVGWQVPLNTGYQALTPNGGLTNFNVSWYGSQRGHLPGGTTAIAIAPYQYGQPGTQNEPGGYLILDSNGGVANYNAPWYGSERADPNGTPVAIAADPLTGGYWILNSNGGVDNYNAPWHGSQRGHLPSGTTARSITVDPVTGGYWILDSNGGVANFNAPWFGSERGHAPSSPVAVVEDPQAAYPGGYVILNAGGSVEGYGHALTYGGETSAHATGLAFDLQTGGYWIINANGGIANFNAPWYGSLAGKTTQAPTGIADY